MSLYRRKRSPYWWMRIPQGHGPARCESTRVLIAAPSAAERQAQRAEADLIYRARVGDIARQRVGLPTTAAAKAGAPIADTLRAFLAWYDTHVVATHRGAAREREILQRWQRDLGELRLPEVTLGRVREWVTKRRAEKTGAKRRKHPIAASTINRELRVLKAALTTAARLEKIPSSPLAGMPYLEETTPKRAYLSVEDEARLLAVMRRPDDRALLIMGLDTLCRLGDCLDLRRVDDHGAKLWIAQTKTGEGRWVPCSTRLRAALDAIPKRGSARYYFAHRRLDTPQRSAYAVRQMLERACAHCTPPIVYGRARGGLTWHWATRRTTATRLALAGKPLPTIQAAGGWRTAQMVLDIYAEAQFTDVAAMMSSMPVVAVPEYTPRAHRTKQAKSGHKSAHS